MKVLEILKKVYNLDNWDTFIDILDLVMEDARERFAVQIEVPSNAGNGFEKASADEEK